MEIHTPGGGICSPAAAEVRVSTASARVGRTRNLKYIMVMSWKEATFLRYLYCINAIRPNYTPQRPQHTGNCIWIYKNKIFGSWVPVPMRIGIDFYIR